MVFENIRIKDVHAILHYTPDIKRWRAENRKNHFIGITLSGSSYHSFDKQSFVLSRNCIYFFNQKDDYSVEVLEPGDSFSVHFTTYEQIETDSFCLPVENPNEITALLQKTEKLSRVLGNDDLSLLSTVYSLCDAFVRAKQKARFPKDMRIRAAKDYIDVNFKDSDCLAAAVSSSGLSSRRFGELFKNDFKTTPNKYLLRRRIEISKSMLEAQGMTVSEVAELCGFSDVYYFSKVFKQICGVPPSKWK